MITKSRLLKKYRDCEKAMMLLSAAQQELSHAASELYGEDLRAAVCGGGEIEFRRYNGQGFVDDLDTLRIEDIINGKE